MKIRPSCELLIVGYVPLVNSIDPWHGLRQSCALDGFGDEGWILLEGQRSCRKLRGKIPRNRRQGAKSAGVDIGQRGRRAPGLTLLKESEQPIHEAVKILENLESRL